MMRFGLLALVSTAATAFYGEAVRSRTVMPGENRNCPTIGVNLGIVGPVLVLENGAVDTFCLAKRRQRDPFTSETNREESEFQFDVTHESKFIRYIWDMSNDDSVWIAGQPKFLAVTTGDFQYLHAEPGEPASPGRACRHGFKFDARHVLKALLDNDVTLIVVPTSKQAQFVWNREILSAKSALPANGQFPKIHVAAATLHDHIFKFGFEIAPKIPFETKVMDAVKAVVYEDLKYSMSDKFPLCSPNYPIPRGGYRPLCPSTQILDVEINDKTVPPENPNFRIDGIERDGYCYQSFDHVKSWNPRSIGWQSQKIKDWSLIRVVYDISTNWGGKLHFSEHAQTAIVIFIPKYVTLLPAPRAEITETDLNNLTVPAALCEAGFEYNWAHFVKGISDDPKMVVLLAPETEPQQSILQEVKRKIGNAGVKERMLISDALCGDCLDELLTYYRTEIPLEFGNCRAELTQ